MADTRVQAEVEDWVRREWLPKRFGVPFSRERLKLRSGGVFDFDAVSDDRTVAMSISTSCCRTRSGRNGVGKMMKLRADVLWLVMAPVSRRYVVLTDRSMYEQCMKEQAAGRVPPEVEFAHAEVPPELAAKLAVAQRAASEEVTPA